MGILYFFELKNALLLHIQEHGVSHLYKISCRVSEWLLFNTKWVIFHPHHGENQSNLLRWWWCLLVPWRCQWTIYQNMFYRNAAVYQYILQSYKFMLCSSNHYTIVGWSPCHVKSKTVKLVFAASPLITQQYGERAKTSYIRIRIMCPSVETCQICKIAVYIDKLQHFYKTYSDILSTDISMATVVHGVTWCGTQTKWQDSNVRQFSYMLQVYQVFSQKDLLKV
jgi:hypothetical protein